MIPLGAWGRVLDDGRLALDAAVFDVNGRSRAFASQIGSSDDPDGLGRIVAEILREQGADTLLKQR